MMWLEIVVICLVIYEIVLGLFFWPFLARMLIAAWRMMKMAKRRQAMMLERTGDNLLVGGSQNARLEISPSGKPQQAAEIIHMYNKGAK